VLQDSFLQILDFHAQRIVGLGRRFGLDAGAQYLFDDLIHS
jgi:hypothetical protein